MVNGRRFCFCFNVSFHYNGDIIETGDSPCSRFGTNLTKTNYSHEPPLKWFLEYVVNVWSIFVESPCIFTITLHSLSISPLSGFDSRRDGRKFKHAINAMLYLPR
uniref:Uncharacterized protein n=1 Tax=Cacopsylla melanoneura TaxID=428564 RepID=A0A8D8VPG2_9HEMI